MRRPEFLQQVQQVARQWGLLVIYDEVMTGFGRTGDWFACATAQTAPDIICLSKGITGGFLPFAATYPLSIKGHRTGTKGERNRNSVVKYAL
jgi:adenosylmethionine---8-amino-7-oxononanoate aminotransferase